MKEQRGRVFFLKKNISIIKAVRRYQEQLTIFLFSTFSVSLFSIQILFKQFFPFFDVCATSLIVRSEGRHFSFPRKVIVLCQDFKPSLFTVQVPTLLEAQTSIVKTGHIAIQWWKSVSNKACVLHPPPPPWHPTPSMCYAS